MWKKCKIPHLSIHPMDPSIQTFIQTFICLSIHYSEYCIILRIVASIPLLAVIINSFALICFRLSIKSYKYAFVL